MGKESYGSLKEKIFLLQELAHEESFVAQKEGIPGILLDLQDSLRNPIELEYVDFVRLKNARAILQSSMALWSAEIQTMLTLLRSKPEYKKMVSEHRGVFRISSRNLFTNILVDRFTLPESFVLRDYQVVISRMVISPTEEYLGGWVV